MTTKKTADLSASLVAIKGAAVPPPDMHARAPLAAVPDTTTAKAAPDGNLSPLNFRISASFRREFKSYAASHDLKLNELLKLSFEAYRRQQGD